MMEAGLIEEVRGLLARGYSRDLPSMSGIGYRQLCQHLAGEFSLEEATARIKTETHRLTRHQRNWFRRDDPRIRWVDASVGDAFKEAFAMVESELALSKGGL